MAIALDVDRATLVAVRGERFYVNMAIACAAVAFLGFAPTYWVPMVRGTLDVPPIAHLHAVLFYGWILLFVKQAMLVASGRVARHRELGLLGVATATGMFFVGMATALNSVHRSEAAGFGEAARAFFIVPATGVVLFAILFAIAIVNVKKPEVHKRLLLVATVSLLQAGVGRWFALFLAPARAEAAGLVGPLPPPPVGVTVAPGVLADLLIVVAMVHDRRTTGRVHPVYWIAGGAVLALQVLRVPLAPTAAWQGLTDWMLAFLP